MKLEELELLQHPQGGDTGEHAALLLDAGSPRGMLAWTPLQYACAHGDDELVLCLLKDTDKESAAATGKNGTTPLDIANELGHTEIAQVLVDHVQKDTGREQIGNWLASIGLVEYAANFHAAGVDDARFLLATGLNDSILDTMKITKPGHRMKLQNLYQLKESIPDPDEESSDNEEVEESDDASSGTEEDNESDDGEDASSDDSSESES